MQGTETLTPEETRGTPTLTPDEPQCTLTLTPEETEVLEQLLHGEQSRLLSEIARADHRPFRELLKQREEVLRGIMRKLGTS